MQRRFHVDNEFSPSRTAHNSRGVERAQEMPPVAILPGPFLEKARMQKHGISPCETQAKEAVLRNGKCSPEKRAPPDPASSILLRSAEMTNYSTLRHMKIKDCSYHQGRVCAPVEVTSFAASSRH